MQHTQSAHGLEITIVLLTLVAIVIVTAFYLSFIRKSKAEHGKAGH